MLNNCRMNMDINEVGCFFEVDVFIFCLGETTNQHIMCVLEYFQKVC